MCNREKGYGSMRVYTGLDSGVLGKTFLRAGVPSAKSQKLFGIKWKLEEVYG